MRQSTPSKSTRPLALPPASTNSALSLLLITKCWRQGFSLFCPSRQLPHLSLLETPRHATTLRAFVQSHTAKSPILERTIAHFYEIVRPVIRFLGISELGISSVVDCAVSVLGRLTWPVCARHYNTTVQLDAGVRLVSAQVHQDGSEWHLCHSTCSLLDSGKLSTWLSEIKDWLDSNPNEGMAYRRLLDFACGNIYTNCVVFP